MSERVFVSLGSNRGSRETYLLRGLQGIAATPGVLVVAASSRYSTAPVGPPGQGPYLNAALELRCRIAPRLLLDRLLRIESAAGRLRSGVRNEARTLDLDLLLFGVRRIREPGLELPHPRLHLRPFVLEPLCELAPDIVHPQLGQRIDVLARAVRNPAAVRRLMGGPPWPSSP